MSLAQALSLVTLCPLCAALGLLSPAQAADSSLPTPLAPSTYAPQWSGASYVFVPSQGSYGGVYLDESWPKKGDRDFNDAVIAYHLAFDLTGEAKVRSLRLVLQPLALGSAHDFGLGLHLPVRSERVSDIHQRRGSLGAVTVAPLASDSELTLLLSPSLRSLFSVPKPFLNTTPQSSPVDSEAIIVDIRFEPPTELNLSAAPFDLFFFHSDEPTHQVHLPSFMGTWAMDPALFGTNDDGSRAGRYFVDSEGIPAVLALPELVPWPQEGSSFLAQYPGIISYAASGGQSDADFYHRPPAHPQEAFSLSPWPLTPLTGPAQAGGETTWYRPQSTSRAAFGLQAPAALQSSLGIDPS